MCGISTIWRKMYWISFFLIIGKTLNNVNTPRERLPPGFFLFLFSLVNRNGKLGCGFLKAHVSKFNIAFARAFRGIWGSRE